MNDKDKAMDAAERELFEAHVREKLGDDPALLYRRTMPGAMFYGEYVNEKIQRHWLGWLARSALTASEAPGMPDALRWTSAALQAIANTGDVVTIDGARKTVGQILDDANNALAAPSSPALDEAKVRDPVYVERLERALMAIRKAAGSARHFTNRLQFIYERSGVALANEDWNEEWKSTNGYKMRAGILDENERLKAELAALKSAPSQQAQQDRECKCDLRTTLVGDGCEICNPRLAAEIERDNLEGMAEAMRMYRDDMIKAGVISENVPPMMMTEAILGAIGRERARALEGAAQQDGWVSVETAMPKHGQMIRGRSDTGEWVEKWDESEPIGAMTHWKPFPPVSAGKEQANG